MEESPFSKKPVDGIKERPVVGISGSLKKPSNINNLVAKILGIGLSCVLAFFIYSLYSEYTDEKDLETYWENNPVQGVEGQSSDVIAPLPLKYIGVEVSNGKTDSPLIIKTSKIAPYTDVKFNITKPDGGLYQFSATAKITGFVQTELEESILTQIGEYKIEAIADGYKSNGEKNFFLRAGDVSMSKSSITADKYTADLGEAIIVKAKLLDKNENPIVGSSVSLISTRETDDEIEYSGIKKTDEEGEIEFIVKSKKSGESSYLLLDKASGRMIDQKVDVVYREPEVILDTVIEPIVDEESEAEPLEAGSSVSFLRFFIPIAFAYSDVAYYTIEGSATFTVGEESALLIKVYDNTNTLITDYTGQINITVTPAMNSILDTYVFKVEDKGQFSLPIKIDEKGTFSISVTSSGNASVKGDKTISVEDVVGGGESQLTAPQILQPSQGAESDTIMNISKINIAGKATENMTIEIYDGEVKLGETISSERGLFFFQTEDLVDGRHNLKAVLIDSEDHSIASEVVSIIIDTTNPALTERSVIIDPSQVFPGGNVKITVKAEPNLESAKAIVNKTVVLLNEDVSKAGTYQGVYKASNSAGTYDVDIELKDSISNPVLFKQQGTLVITEKPIVVSDPVPTPIPDIPIYNPSPIETSPDTGPAELFIAMFIASLLFVFIYKYKKI